MPFHHRRPLRREPVREPLRNRLTRHGGAASLSDAWRAWLIENLALDASEDDLLACLRASGVPTPIGRREIETLRHSPATTAARGLARLLKRHELFVRLQRTLGEMARRPREVERRSGLSHDEFFERYYAGNVPVVITDGLAPWPKLAQWSPASLKERFGEVDVEIMSDRNAAARHTGATCSAGPACTAELEGCRKVMRLAAFCDRVVTSAPTNDFYLVANNRITNRAPLKPLFDDVSGPHEYLDDRRDAGWTSMWFGPAGTVTPLHHDTANVFFCQIFGRKSFVLVPPFELDLIGDMHHSVYSSFDPGRSDLEGASDLAAASKKLTKEVVLAAGEALFVPVGWWHHVQALDVSISLAFTSFRLPNRFDWYYPGRIY